MTELPIRATGLAKTYRIGFALNRRVNALRGLDLQVERSSIYGLLGPNGAGKSTTIKILLNLVQASAGSATLFGRPVSNREARRRVGYVPENPAPYEYLTGLEFVRLCGRVLGLSGADLDAQCTSTLDRVGLSRAKHLQIRRYSKGMIQRVALAQALLGSPELLSLAALAIFLSCGSLNQEIQRRTIFIIMSKPISRSAFLLSRVGAILLTLLVLLLVMGALFLMELKVYGAPFHRSQLAAMAMLFVELVVLTSFGALMSTFAGPIVSAVVVAGVYFAGHASRDLYIRAQRSGSALLRVLGKGAYYLLPNLDRLDYKPAAAYTLEPSGRELLVNAGYGLAYAAVVLLVATLIFDRRDFK